MNSFPPTFMSLIVYLIASRPFDNVSFPLPQHFLSEITPQIPLFVRPIPRILNSSISLFWSLPSSSCFSEFWVVSNDLLQKHPSRPFPLSLVARMLPWLSSWLPKVYHLSSLKGSLSLFSSADLSIFSFSLLVYAPSETAVKPLVDFRLIV